MSMKNNLSAGRVQSVAVRLIAEREREITAFVPQSSFKVEALFTAPDTSGKQISFKAEGSKFNKSEAAENFLQECKGASYSVKDIQVKPTKRSPAAPFTTSTLQQEASRKLGYGVSRTMLLAQKLYENGHITYMRTDSVNLSDTAMQDISATIKSSYGDKYYSSRKYKSKSQSAQEAHEAIRPTNMSTATISDSDANRLYDLIWKRTMTSQMADAILEKTVAKINVSTNNAELTAQGEVLKFDGFIKVYREDVDEEDADGEQQQDSMLPLLTVGMDLPLQEMKAVERFSRPLPRYSEASLVKKLEELGIGRPSTFAPTISTILKRGYVEKRDKEGLRREYQVYILKNDQINKKTETENTGAEKAKLFPTDLGLLVTDFLKQHFDNIMDYGFTARIEEEFDEIAQGKLKWHTLIDDFYNPFKKDVEKTIETADRISGERELGVDPKSGKPVIARMGRYGPMVQIGSSDEEEKPQYAKLKSNQSIETISLDEAMELFKLPRSLGEFEGQEVTVSIGRFGPYIAHDKKFYSLSKNFDPYVITLEEAIPIIEEKRKAKDERTIKVFEKEKIQILNGPYGPYVKQGLRNFKLSKEQEQRAKDLTIEEVKKIIEEGKANPPKRSKSKRKA
jgi:DNA topoisomerase-1